MQIQNLEFDQMTGALLKDPKYCQMKQYIQHGRCSTYDHCIAVAKLCFLWGRKLPIEVKEKEMVRGALLHDYYLYDWHNYDGKRHGFRYAKIAEKNASRDFSLSDYPLPYVATEHLLDTPVQGSLACLSGRQGRFYTGDLIYALTGKNT